MLGESCTRYDLLRRTFVQQSCDRAYSFYFLSAGTPTWCAISSDASAPGTYQVEYDTNKQRRKSTTATTASMLLQHRPWVSESPVEQSDGVGETEQQSRRVLSVCALDRRLSSVGGGRSDAGGRSHGIQHT